MGTHLRDGGGRSAIDRPYFTSVFPDGTIWLVGEGDLLLIGSVAPRIDERVASVAPRSQLGVTPDCLPVSEYRRRRLPFVLLSFYAGGPREAAIFGGSADVQTDDRMALEFTAAHAMYAPPPGNAAVLRAMAASASLPPAAATIVQSARAEDWMARGDAALRAEAFAVAHESFRRAAVMDSRSARALRGATDAAAGMRRLAEEVDWLKTLAAAEPGNAAVRVELSHALATIGDADAALAAAMDAKRIDPASPEPLEQFASILADAGDGARLRPAADELASRFPSRHEGRYYQAAALVLAERPADAERAVRILLSADPRHAKGHNLLGVVCAARRDLECARAAFTRSLELNPRDPSVTSILAI